MIRFHALLILASLWPSTAGLAQIPTETDPEVNALAAQAIGQWMDDFERGRIGAHGGIAGGARLQPAYMRAAQQAGFVPDANLGRLTHLDMLQKLLFFAEKYPSRELAEAVLTVASAGIERSLLDREAYELRELGHWTMMRMDDQGVWFLVLRAAAGERVPVFSAMRKSDDKEEAVSVGPARRVAALRLLGQKALPVFRSTLESALVDADPRVRLAAAESIRAPWNLKTIFRVGKALRDERHPVVSQALVRLLFKMMKRPPKNLRRDQQFALIDGAMQQFGRAGWRTDMDLLDFVEAYPSKAAIPKLIQALDLEVRSPDLLVSAVNKRASPLLRQRAGDLLRAMTGALVPIEDPAAWRAFWAAEKDNIVVPETLKKPNPKGTRVEFFGVPVTGTSIGFLIDTSGSMDDPTATNAPLTGPRRVRRARTRLEAAKEQLVLAAQAMDEESQYYLLTFADKARNWTRTPIKPHKRATRSITGLLSRLNAHGGTNLYAGLVEALEMQGRKFGGEELPKIDELFVLSDGQPTTGEVRDTETLLTLVREANKYAKVRINAVFTGTGGGSALLKRLAEENGGVFVQR